MVKNTILWYIFIIFILFPIDNSIMIKSILIVALLMFFINSRHIAFLNEAFEEVTIIDNSNKFDFEFIAQIKTKI
ncbi:hypothetical protein QIA34_06695 (plasmid) [Borreliella yangtzensis]|uniref:hypothetical protein n=1 Tax=Borreliella yangtzensis TaxID=683292 RepID=UPI003B680684